jgi:hypothetical protein
VRIEFPNGTAVEGYVMRDLCYVEFGFGRALDMIGAEMDPEPIRPVITVLAEPRPEEPTGLGAVVEAAYADHPRQKWVNNRGDADGPRNRWTSIPYWGFLDWDCLVDPVVLSEGWTE